jgi:mannose-6-phosphate isomerase-like protein (cupin superfamily)
MEFAFYICFAEKVVVSESCLMKKHIQSAQIVLPCQDLNETLDFFIEKLGFRIETIFPADSPLIAVISGFGITLRLLCNLNPLPDEIIAPNGTRIQFAEENPPIILPQAKQEFVLSRVSDNWGTGRAGMQYRDLIPNRLGGRFIASHIRIPGGGEVPDYVHFHKVIFQIIFCKTGWAKLVYEDQGEPFILNEGDCVLQPPEIRHRVLEASAGLEVIEIGCPAIHETFADHDLKLPTAQILPDGLFNGQKFVHHIAGQAKWQKSNGFEFRETGIFNATNGLAEVKVLRANSTLILAHQHSGDFLFYFVLKGEAGLDSKIFGNHRLNVGDSCVIPSGIEYILEANKGLEILEVYLPKFKTLNRIIKTKTFQIESVSN